MLGIQSYTVNSISLLCCDIECRLKVALTLGQCHVLLVPACFMEAICCWWIVISSDCGITGVGIPTPELERKKVIILACFFSLFQWNFSILQYQQ